MDDRRCRARLLAATVPVLAAVALLGLVAVTSPPSAADGAGGLDRWGSAVAGLLVLAGVTVVAVALALRVARRHLVRSHGNDARAEGTLPATPAPASLLPDGVVAAGERLPTEPDPARWTVTRHPAPPEPRRSPVPPHVDPAAWWGHPAQQGRSRATDTDAPGPSPAPVAHHLAQALPEGRAFDRALWALLDTGGDTPATLVEPPVHPTVPGRWPEPGSDPDPSPDEEAAP